MINKVIRGFTRILGKPPSWDPSTHGECGALAIMDHEHVAVEGQPGYPSMISAWDVTPDEMIRLRQGAPIYLRVAGEGHPPVCIWVGFPSLDVDAPARVIAATGRTSTGVGSGSPQAARASARADLR